MQVTTIGIDLAKSVFQVHGVDATGGVLGEEEAASSRGARLFQIVTIMPGRDGGVRDRAFLGAGDRRAGSRLEAPLPTG